ncbi:NAD-dependent epimerase/dehydratase family protein [Merdimonas faecis]|uniref:NAD-dependent epimerase/dehydratase family protein n=1 Tax=Merdimonas faecis TaxID=1653435 RepID=UPI0023F9205F|nr:NAD(P)-dependent oxidoreductase [Merdimonas faecis]
MVVIIGATGFIGMYTVERMIAAGKKVVATGRNKKVAHILTNMGAEFVELDITKREDFDKLPTENIEGVILLAGLLPANAKVDLTKDENAGDYFVVNVLGTINVLEYCRKNGIKKVINCSSYSDVSGAWKKGVAIKETEPRNFKFTGDHAVYVISKNAAIDVMEYYNQQHDMQCACFRFPPVYGVGPHSTIYVNGKSYKSGIQTFIEQAQKGEPIEIWGDPHICRDIIYVKDVATAFVKALDSDKTKGLYNMTSGTELDLEDQVKAVIEVFGGEKKSEIIYRPDKPNNTPSFLFDMTKAKEDFGFVPEYTSYIDIMKDYKRELESGRWDILVDSRKKD